ncbi:hypothetical protein M427DRAFT_489406 [Gonapodya prolifera JEL478]|uniref:Cas12f1-like TNB domain-containing protein n=1 Tax=Gonapodya prolifera (strain JEL478) TaxID=1344416 RepID=A0A139APC2_GONPJ|nr:hypothetical protein M427DRAFT_489406 [Gonapodya prolifera JEL478]|eukprot:KXS18494.1 hypothetical protein M427DRAFT_489406 [Gonapodya prolifera JEL478]
MEEREEEGFGGRGGRRGERQGGGLGLWPGNSPDGSAWWDAGLCPRYRPSLDLEKDLCRPPNLPQGKFRTYEQSQRVIRETIRRHVFDPIVEMLREGIEVTRVKLVYGGANFSSTSRGHAPSVDRRFIGKDGRQIVRVVEVIFELLEEYHSSALCSCCHGYAEPVTVTNFELHDTVKRRRRPWGLKKCTRCGIVFNRDHNAVRNMEYIYLFRQMTGHRPPGYRVPPSGDISWRSVA